MARLPDHTTRDALLKSARAVFARCGFDAAGVEVIARGAGVAKGSFYLHFRSKEDCFLELVHQLFAYLEALVAERSLEVCRLWQRLLAQEATDEQWQAELRRENEVHYQQILRAIWTWRDIAGLLVTGGTGARFGYLIEQMAQRIVERELRWTRLEQEAGLLRHDVDADHYIGFVAGGFIGLAQQMVRRSEPPDFAAWSASLARLLDGGMVGRGPLSEAGLQKLVEAASSKQTPLPATPSTVGGGSVEQPG